MVKVLAIMFWGTIVIAGALIIWGLAEQLLSFDGATYPRNGLLKVVIGYGVIFSEAIIVNVLAIKE